MSDVETDIILDQVVASEPDHHFGHPVVNDTDFSTEEIYAAMSGEDRRIVASLSEWGRSVSSGTAWNTRGGGIMNRDAYVTPSNIFDQMALAYDALDRDDIVSGAAESTESLAFSRVSFWHPDISQQDVWNQWAGDIDLDARLREMWRELFTVSQFYVGIWWTTKTYKVRGKSKQGNALRKEFSLQVPEAITLLDPMKIIPVGQLMFNQERLAYNATREEADKFDKILSGAEPGGDAIVERLIEGRYELDNAEKKQLSDEGVKVDNLFLLKADSTFRHTLTRPQFQRFSPVRMRAIFELLDLKYQLRQMDRTFLIGGTNFIILVTKGSDKHPAKREEIANLQASAQMLARIPLLIGDHRLSVEIITPKLDNTLKAERYNTVDSRITARIYQIFVLGNYAAGSSGDDSNKLTRVIGRGMESRRHMIKRVLERKIFKLIVEKNEELEDVAKLQFHPSRIALDFDAAWASFLLELRARNEISRESVHGQFDFDQRHEAELREREKELGYDDIFETLPEPGSPVSGPAQSTPDNGGGRRNGGGAAPGSGQGQSPRNPSKRSDRGKKLPPMKSNHTITIEGENGEVLAVTTPEEYESVIADLGLYEEEDE